MQLRQRHRREGPYASLILDTAGSLYGTTYQGGAYSAGIVFALTPTGGGGWRETVLHSFDSDGTDGFNPRAGLILDGAGHLYGTTTSGGTYNGGTVFELQTTAIYTLTVSIVGNGTVTSTDGNINCPGSCSYTYAYGTQVTLNAAPGEGWVFGGWNGGCLGTAPCTVTMTQSISVDAIFSEALQFVAATPCRVVDTRNANGTFGGPAIPGGTSRSFPIPQGSCDIPTTAAAYSLNVTVVPNGVLGYLTIWPTGENQPVVSTMNSLDGRIKANAAIVPAGTNEAVSVYVSNTTNVVLDIDGYFTQPTQQTLQFYPLTPCRVLDTRNASGDLGGPFLNGGDERDFPVLESSCIPQGVTPLAYSMNFTVVPVQGQPLGYLTVWPAGQSKPVVSTLNNLTATLVANAAIVPAGTNGAIAAFPSQNTQLVGDIDGYFATAGTGGLSLYPTAPCRVIDTRKIGNGQPFSGTADSAGERGGQRLRHTDDRARLRLQCDGGAVGRPRLSDLVAGQRRSACGLDAERRRWLDHLEHGDCAQRQRQHRRLRVGHDATGAGHFQLLRAVGPGDRSGGMCGWPAGLKLRRRCAVPKGTQRKIPAHPGFRAKRWRSILG